MEPVADHASAGRKLRRFAHAEQQPGGEELAEALDESADEAGRMTKGRGRTSREGAARTCRPSRRSAIAKTHRPRERRTEDSPCPRSTGRDRGGSEIGDSERRAVDVVDHAGHDQHGQRRPLDRSHPRRRLQRFQHRGFLALRWPVWLSARLKSIKAPARSMLSRVHFIFTHSRLHVFVGSSVAGRGPENTMLPWRTVPLALQQTCR